MPVAQERSWINCIYAEREKRTRTGCQVSRAAFFTRPQGIVNEMTGMRKKMLWHCFAHKTVEVSMRCLGGAILFVIIPALYIIVHAIKMGVVLTA